MPKRRIFLYCWLCIFIFIIQLVIYELYLNLRSMSQVSTVDSQFQPISKKLKIKDIASNSGSDKLSPVRIGTSKKEDHLYQFDHEVKSFYEHINYQMNFIPANTNVQIRNKRILLYNGFNVSRTLGTVKPGKRTFLEHNCPLISCELTANKDEMEETDAVVWQDSIDQHSFSRPRNQIWIMYNTESPLYTSSTFKRMNNNINWTMTYRHDSTISTPYFTLIRRFSKKHHNHLRTINHAQGKSKLVAAVISNCDTKNNRMVYVKELSQYIKVDVYGKCGNLTCPEDEKCFEMLGKKYKFLLAFENSNCRDYITEKMYKAYKYNMVPVVMGAHPDDYKRLAPTHSYIHVDQFYSPRHLAKFLSDINSNDAVYSSYFDWKIQGYISISNRENSPWCRLCTLLNEVDNRPNEKQFYKNVDHWWRYKACVPEKWEFVFN